MCIPFEPDIDMTTPAFNMDVHVAFGSTLPNNRYVIEWKLRGKILSGNATCHSRIRRSRHPRDGSPYMLEYIIMLVTRNHNHCRDDVSTKCILL